MKSTPFSVRHEYVQHIVFEKNYSKWITLYELVNTVIKALNNNYWPVTRDFESESVPYHSQCKAKEPYLNCLHSMHVYIKKERFFFGMHPGGQPQ